EDGGHFKIGEVVEDGLASFGVDLAGVLDGIGVRVAVDAFEVAGARDVPDDDGAAFFGGLGDGHALVRGRIDLGDLAAVAVGGAGGFEAAVKDAHVDHGGG